MAAAQTNEQIRFEPDEACPPLLAIGVALQIVIVMLAGAIMITAIIVRAGGQSDTYLSWAIFMVLVTSGVATILQAVRIRRFGSGHLVLMNPHPAYIPVCIIALQEGGPALMASLILVASLCQFVLTPRISLLRRIVTPAVSGTLLMLVALISIRPIFGLLKDAPPGASLEYGPVIALVTLVVITVLMLVTPRSWQLWTSLIGIVAGCLVAVPFGLYDFQLLREASWAGLPDIAWPGAHLSLGVEFWALLPAFVVVSLTSFIKTIGDGVAVQQVSRRRPRATDFRVIQGVLYANGMGGLLAGLAGTIPNASAAIGASIASLTGVASARVAIYAGAIYIVIAFLPKIAALVLAIPGFVMVPYMLILMSILFMEGVRTVFQGGIDQKKIIVAGVSFWIGIGFENGYIFPELLDGLWGALLGNGLTSGGICAILVTVFIDLTSPRRRRLNTDLHISSLPKVDEFLSEFAAKAQWNEASTDRLRSVGEETLSIMLTDEVGDANEGKRRLIIAARMVEDTAELEFLSASDEENLEDRLSYLSEQPETVDEREISFRLLRFYASSVQHRKYHNVDIVAVEVQGSR